MDVTARSPRPQIVLRRVIATARISGEVCVGVCRGCRADKKYDSAGSKRCAMWDEESMEEKK